MTKNDVWMFWEVSFLDLFLFSAGAVYRFPEPWLLQQRRQLPSRHRRVPRSAAGSSAWHQQQLPRQPQFAVSLFDVRHRLFESPSLCVLPFTNWPISAKCFPNIGLLGLRPEHQRISDILDLGKIRLKYKLYEILTNHFDNSGCEKHALSKFTSLF